MNNNIVESSAWVRLCKLWRKGCRGEYAADRNHRDLDEQLRFSFSPMQIHISVILLIISTSL
jgi:hypothetical protein